MILPFIIAVSFFQFALYFLKKKYDMKFSNSIILGVVLLFHFFIFPQLFFPPVMKGDMNCGMPTLAITLAFWFFGGIAAVTTHIIWWMKNRTKKENRI